MLAILGKRMIWLLGLIFLTTFVAGVFTGRMKNLYSKTILSVIYVLGTVAVYAIAAQLLADLLLVFPALLPNLASSTENIVIEIFQFIMGAIIGHYYFTNKKLVLDYRAITNIRTVFFYLTLILVLASQFAKIQYYNNGLIGSIQTINIELMGASPEEADAVNIIMKSIQN